MLTYTYTSIYLLAYYLHGNNEYREGAEKFQYDQERIQKINFMFYILTAELLLQQRSQQTNMITLG